MSKDNTNYLWTGQEVNEHILRRITHGLFVQKMNEFIKNYLFKLFAVKSCYFANSVITYPRI